MSISRYNVEGYLDLTAFEALSKIEQEEKEKSKNIYKPIVFICSPYAGDVEGNIMRAKRYARYAVTQDTIPIIPHLMYPQFLFDDDPDERRLGLGMGLILLTKCHELWVFGDTISNGMKEEIKKARNRVMPIKYFSIDCTEVANR